MAEQTTLEERHQRIENRIRSFHAKFDSMLEGLEHEDIVLQPPEDEDDWLDDDEANNEPQITAPEFMPIFMPSSLQHADIQRLGLEPMAKQEMELRQGQANDALEGLRLALGQKALLYRSKVRDLPPDDGIGFDPGTVEECQKQ